MTYEVSRLKGFDLDDELDWKFAEFISNKN